jgi:hypothetical protein
MKEAASLNAWIERNENLSALFLLAKKHFIEEARAWGVTHKVMGIILVMPFVIAIMGVLTALMGKDAYKWLTREDGFAESLQVIFYFVAFILCLAITRWQWKSDHRLVAVLYTALCVGLFFLTGEEINWGQRMIGWETSPSFAAINKQGETNLHNIYGVGASFKWVQLLVGAYGCLLPLAVLRWGVPERFRHLVSWVIPPLALIPYFFFLFAWRLFRNFFEEPEGFYFVIAEYNEVMELILAAGLLLFMVYQMRRLKKA